MSSDSTTPAGSPPPSAAPSPGSWARGLLSRPVAWVVLSISLIATAGGWSISRMHVELAARKQFDQEVSRITATLNERMAIYQDVLHGSVGLFAASRSVEWAEWRAYQESVSVEKRFPGIDSVAFIACVPREKLDEFLKNTREDESPEFALKEPSDADELFIFKYITPEERHRSLAGRDISVQPERRAVAEKTRDSGETAITSMGFLLKEEGRELQTGFVMMLPVYRRGAPTGTVVERHANLEGWVYARFVMSGLMRGILGGQLSTLRIEVFDGPDTDLQKRVFDETGSGPQTSNADYHPLFSDSIAVKLPGRTWMMRFTTTPAFDATISHLFSTLVGAGGIIVSLLLFGIAWSLSTTRDRAVAMASEMTATLRATAERLEKEIAGHEHARRRTATQYAVTRVLAEAPTLSEAAGRIVEAICESLGWDVGALWQLNAQTRQLHCVEVWHQPGRDVAEFVSATRKQVFAHGVGLPGRIWAENKPAWISEVSQDQNFPRAPFAQKAGLHGAFGVPVLMDKEFFGVVEFFSREILEPDPELQNMMAAIGSQIGQFIERRRAGAALKESESLYHSLLEGLPVNILRKDLQGRFTFANQGFCADIGKSLDDILGKTDFDLFPPDLAAKYQQDDQRVTEGGGTIETIEEHHVPGGENRFVQVIKTPVFDGAGKASGLLAIFWDVTDKRRAEQALEYERYLLHTLMDNLPDRIYFKDSQSRFIRANQAMFARHRLTKEAQLIGKTDFDLFSEEHARQAFDDEQQILKTGQPFTKEEKETWPDGSVTWALSTKLPMRDERGRIVGTFGISRDITDRKRAEQTLRQAKEAAEEASRIKSQFLASMSHELRTPLNSVIGFANILLKNKAGNLAAPDLNFLERIQANGKHLLGLINQILDLSKIEARKVELQLAPVALDVLVRETIAQQEGLVRDRPVQLLADLPPKLATIPTDADKLKQVIINLIGNALKFTERGSVTVRVDADPTNRCPVRLDVVDTGIGIPKEKCRTIFEAFQQADGSTARKYGGTGLGLTISQALCQLMGYRIEVSSELGKGSTFSVVFQPHPESGQPAPAPTEPAQLVAVPSTVELQDKLVLVIDDETDSRTLLTHVLEEFGCEVLAASSGDQGLRMAREFRPHLITVDLLMPHMNGWQVVQAIKAEPELRDIPVVVVSVVASENRGRVLGAVDVLQKPVVREELLAVLQRNIQPPSPKLLVVDDDADARGILTSYLEGHAGEIRVAANGREALDALELFSPDLVLLDLMMPVMDGMTFLHLLRSDPRFQRLPVVVITAKELTPAESEQLKRVSLRVLNKAEVFEGNLKRQLEELVRGIPNPPRSPATGASHP